MMKIFKKYVLFILVCLLWLPAAQAEPENGGKADCPDCNKTEPVKLGNVFVTAFHGGAVTITPTKTVIDIEEFNKSGSVDRVEDILMHLTGIDVMRGSTGADPQQIIMMRGFDDSRFTIAIDGRTITAPTAGADTYVDWSSLTTGDIEKIEVIRGAASAQYENSQGGVINIITKKGKKRDTLIPKLTLLSDYSRFDTFTIRSTADGGIKNLTYFFNVGYKESDGYLRNNDYDGYDYSGRLGYTFPFDGILTLSVKGSGLDMGYAIVNDPNAVYGDYDSNYPIVPEDADTIRRYRTMSYNGEVASLDSNDNYKKKKAIHKDIGFEQPFNKSTLKLQFYETTGEEDSYYVALAKNPDYDPNPPKNDPPELEYELKQSFSGDDARKEKQIGGRFQYKMDFWDNNSLVVGYDQRRMEVKSMPDVWRMEAGYFEDTWQINSRMSALLGMRYANIREKTYAYSDEEGNPKDSRYRHDIRTELWLPKSTLTYQYSPDTSVFVSVNKDYHVPGC